MRVTLRSPRMGRWWTLLAVCLGTFMLLVDVTIVNVALAGDRGGPRVGVRGSAVGDRRLRADLGRRPARGRVARGSAGAAPDLRDRRGAVQPGSCAAGRDRALNAHGAPATNRPALRHGDPRLVRGRACHASARLVNQRLTKSSVTWHWSVDYRLRGQLTARSRSMPRSAPPPRATGSPHQSAPAAAMPEHAELELVVEPDAVGAVGVDRHAARAADRRELARAARRDDQEVLVRPVGPAGARRVREVERAGVSVE